MKDLKIVHTLRKIMNDPINIIFQLAVLMFSVILHEIAHGWAALKLGDNTAKRLGRLSLNPAPHIDPFMTIILPLLLSLSGMPPLGGAKPVPVNPHNFNHASPRRGMMLVALAGPLTNFSLAIIFTVILAILARLFPSNIALFQSQFVSLLFYAILINLVLGLFNMLPLPPLDGSKVLAGLLPLSWAAQLMQLERYGLFVIYGLIFMFGNQLSGLYYGLFEWLIRNIISP